MKQLVLLVLICLNAALLVALVFGATAEKAYAQGIGSSYLVMTGLVNDDYDALYVLDVTGRRLAAWTYRRKQNQGRLVPVTSGGARDLLRDFGRAQGRR